MSTFRHPGLIEKLESTRSKIRPVLSNIDEAGKPVELDQTGQGRVSRIDAITQQQMAKAGCTHLDIQLRRIAAALERHQAGRYGHVADGIGFIARCRIATRNGVMLISHIHHLARKEGIAKPVERTRRGAQGRVVPIVMMVLATALVLPALYLRYGKFGTHAAARASRSRRD